jgi:mono/diheme cytochrome c family protein
MKKFLQWAAIGLMSLAGLLTLALLGIYLLTQERINRLYNIPTQAPPIPTDSQSIAYGKHIFQFRGCQACHGEQLQGKVYLSDPALGEVNASNLTSGKGGVAGSYPTPADWARALRHGVRPNGKPLLFMPSTEFYFLSEEDLGAVIAYIHSAAPIDHEQAPSSLSLTGRVAMTLIKEITFLPAELIPHHQPPPPAPPAALTPEYGEYLSQSCKVCHGLGMAGGKIPAFPAGWPSAANLTTSPERYLPYPTEEGFVQIMRTGITRHGRQIDPAYMPWTSYQYMTDEELRAVWVYLQSLPPQPTGSR